MILLPLPSYAQSFFLPDGFSGKEELQQVGGIFIRSIGLMTLHRPYEPATPISTPMGMNLGIELTLVKIPEEMIEAIQTVGSTPPSVSAVPVPRLHFQKSFNPKFGIGLSYAGLQKYFLAGGDIKWVVSQPSEGPTWAIRFCYSVSHIDFIKTKAYSPQLIVSKAMAFADPYIGIGYTWVKGKIRYPLEFEGHSIGELALDDKGTSWTAFTGLQFRSGLHLVIEGGYQSASTHTLGTKIGLSF